MGDAGFLAAAGLAETGGLQLITAWLASAGFATPLGYQTHLMVYGAGGYRFADFVKIGLPRDLLCMAVTVALVPFFYLF